MNRRNFLKAILVAGTAPAVVKASSLMKIAEPKIIVPDLQIYDDLIGVREDLMDVIYNINPQDSPFMSYDRGHELDTASYWRVYDKNYEELRSKAITMIQGDKTWELVQYK